MANQHRNSQNTGWIISGVAIGTGIALAYAASRRRKDHWQDRLVEKAETVVRKRGDLVDSGRDVIDRIRIIYDESRKLVEDATDLWAHGRRLVRG